MVDTYIEAEISHMHTCVCVFVVRVENQKNNCIRAVKSSSYWYLLTYPLSHLVLGGWSIWVPAEMSFVSTYMVPSETPFVPFWDFKELSITSLNMIQCEKLYEASKVRSG